MSGYNYCVCCACFSNKLSYLNGNELHGTLKVESDFVIVPGLESDTVIVEGYVPMTGGGKSA